MSRSKYEFIVSLKDGSVVKINDWSEVMWAESPSRLRFLQSHGEHTTIMGDCILMITKRRITDAKTKPSI